MYVDGFLLAVPTANKEKYREHAEKAVPIFKEFGMTRMVECWGDDIPDGKVPDKETRDAAGQKMMSDPRMAEMAECPFDAKRMIFSGFAPILQSGSTKGADYIDGFVIPVDVKKQADYQAVAEAAAPVFIDHGASGVVETWGEDLMRGEVTDFYRAVEATDDETIVFSWIAWPSKEARDAGNKASMEDERFAAMGPESMPFDGRRMIMGGFIPIVDQ
jgi:uncharacterized protein YbaA (DUF1428 family)